jgi:hypothetical protein
MDIETNEVHAVLMAFAKKLYDDAMIDLPGVADGQVDPKAFVPVAYEYMMCIMRECTDLFERRANRAEDSTSRTLALLKADAFVYFMLTLQEKYEQTTAVE